MRISEVIDILEQLKENKGNDCVLGISVNHTNITVCYGKTEYGEVKSYRADYKNCDLYQ